MRPDLNPDVPINHRLIKMKIHKMKTYRNSFYLTGSGYLSQVRQQVNLAVHAVATMMPQWYYLGCEFSLGLT